MAQNLLAGTLIGGLYLVILFALCFFAVIGWKLLRRYRAERKKADPPPPADPPAEKKDPPPAPQKVYYLVEKKRTSKKAQYDKPKEIRFK